MSKTSSIRRAFHRQAVSEGFPLQLAYRWADGFVQRAIMRVDEAREHLKWMADYPNLEMRRVYARDLTTGRFVRV